MRRVAFTPAVVVAAIVALALVLPASVGAGSPTIHSNATNAIEKDELTADLDGKPIKLAEVGTWYCHDFDYPAIHCFSDSDDLESSTMAALTITAVTYVTVYEFTTYQGAYMHMSQDYSILTLIGWSDRISSFVAKNSAGGVFWTDWFYTGSRYSFCCYQQFGSLGSYNDTFSSVFHN